MPITKEAAVKMSQDESRKNDNADELERLLNDDIRNRAKHSSVGGSTWRHDFTQRAVDECARRFSAAGWTVRINEVWFQVE